MAGNNRIMIFGPKSDGTYVVEFRTAAGETLAISIPSSEAAVVRYFQERMPYGLFVPDLQEPIDLDDSDFKMATITSAPGHQCRIRARQIGLATIVRASCARSPTACDAARVRRRWQSPRRSIPR